MSKVVCAVSGGVDSAVAALLLKKQGHVVVGAFMKNWDMRDETGQCSTETDLIYAERVCKELQIPFHVIDFVKEYWTNVFQETLDEYEIGHTPNPDVLCNKHIKFDAFFNYSKSQLAATAIATGHYARTSENMDSKNLSLPIGFESKDGRNDGFLYKALDEGKDQTFFLNRISSNVLRHTIFPLGGLQKKEVKNIACSNGLEFVSKRKESMGMCFIGLRNFNKFIDDYIPPKQGRFICLESGSCLGRHDGYFKYTLGQRARLGVSRSALYVAGKNVRSGDIYVVPGTSHRSLFSKAFVAEVPHWINDSLDLFHGKIKMECGIRVMHREPIVGSRIYSLQNDHCLIILDNPLRAVTPGQSAVIYSGLKCLGGSKICHIGPSYFESSAGYPQLSSYRDDISLWNSIWEKFGDQIVPLGDSVPDGICIYNKLLESYRHAISQ